LSRSAPRTVAWRARKSRLRARRVRELDPASTLIPRAAALALFAK